MMLNPLIRQEIDRLIKEKRQIVELRHELTFERMLNKLGKIALDEASVVLWRQGAQRIGKLLDAAPRGVRSATRVSPVSRGNRDRNGRAA